jgi:hypothetical protein
MISVFAMFLSYSAYTGPATLLALRETTEAPMPLTMNREVFITCAVTGSGGTQERSPHVPRSPAQIAASGALPCA